MNVIWRVTIANRKIHFAVELYYLRYASGFARHRPFNNGLLCTHTLTGL